MDFDHQTTVEIDNIKSELYSALDKLIKGCETLDMKLAFEIFSDSASFLMMGTDGSLCDYQTYLKNNIDYLKDCNSFKLNTFKKEIRIINKETAVLSWAYGVEAKLKTGEVDLIDNAGASFVFSKIQGNWKVVYYHESSVSWKRIKA